MDILKWLNFYISITYIFDGHEQIMMHWLQRQIKSLSTSPPYTRENNFWQNCKSKFFVFL